jgi:glycosyltransferase involved in cell wall biosynthesis
MVFRSIEKDMQNKTPLRICHISTVHGRYDNRIFNKQCTTLANSGYDVHLVIADGKGNEIKNGVHIWDVGKLRGRIKRFIQSSYNAYKKAVELEAELYQFHDPELIPIGLKLEKLGKRVLFDSHEDYRKQIRIKPYIAPGIRHLLSFFYSFYEDYAIRKFDGVIVPQKTMVGHFSHLNPRVQWVGNSMVLDEPFELEQKDYYNRTAYYPGAISKARGIFNIVRTMEYMDHEEDKLILAGSFDSDILYRKAQSEKGWSRVEYLGRRPFSEIKQYHKSSSVGLILFEETGQYHFAYTVKLFEFMYFGNPVLMPNFGEWIEFNREFDCGINVDTSKHKEVAGILKELHENPSEKRRLGQNGQKAVINQLNWNVDAGRLFDLYDQVLEE